MHTKTYINNYIRSKIGEAKTPRDVEQIHKFFEAYLKHLALTILRLNGGKYKEAKEYISKSWIPCSLDQTKKMILVLLNQRPRNKQYWIQLLKKNQKLEKLLELLFNYATKVRNLTFHGNYYPFQEGEEDLIYDIYIKSIESLEQLISKHKKGNKILKNTPTDFGAKTGHLTRKNQFKQILSFQMAGQPYSYAKAQQLYNMI